MAEVSIDMELFRRYVILMGGENIVAFYPGFEQNPGAGEFVEDWSTNGLNITNIMAYDDVPYIRGSQLAHIFNASVGADAGDEYWEHADHDAFSMGADGTAGNEPCFTLGQWICPKVDITDHALIAKWDDVTPATEYMLSLEGNGYPRFEIWDDSVADAIGREDQTAIVLDEWSFVVGRYEGGGDAQFIDVLLNGVATDDADYLVGAAYDAMENTAAPFQVGCDDGGGAGATPELFYQGHHWGAFLTDCVLPDANILELYRVGRRLLEI